MFTMLIIVQGFNGQTGGACLRFLLGNLPRTGFGALLYI